MGAAEMLGGGAADGTTAAREAVDATGPSPSGASPPFSHAERKPKTRKISHLRIPDGYHTVPLDGSGPTACYGSKSMMLTEEDRDG
jgi:hypothetical protein